MKYQQKSQRVTFLMFTLYMYATAVRNRTSAVRTCEHRITPRYCNWTIAIIAIDGLWFFLDKFTKKKTF